MGEHEEHRGLVSGRTTLDIDVDVLSAAKEIAAARNVAVGVVVSELLRTARTKLGDAPKRIVMNGLRLVPPTGKKVTSEQVRKLRENGV